MLTEGERADRAWLALVRGARGRPAPATSPAPVPALPRDRLETARVAAVARPRLLWRINALLDAHHDALEQFFQIKTPSVADVDELFEYLRTRPQTEETKTQLVARFPDLIELRPCAAAALAAERSSEELAAILETNSTNAVLEFGRRTLESGRLAGDAAAAHLRNLCIRRPDEVVSFLVENSGTVRPETALAIVRELGPSVAVPVCLEAVGDSSGALDAILRQTTDADATTVAEAVLRASELCTRVSPTVPRAVAADMWGRLLRGASARSAVTAALLLEAAAYLPVEDTLGGMCDSARTALAVLGCAAARRNEWQCAERILGVEIHVALARAFVAARRGVAVRGRCVRCTRPFAERPVLRTSHCARATHADCETEGTCTVCGRCVTDVTLTLPTRPTRTASTFLPPDHPLSLVAPPRPDLEGTV